MKYLPLAQALKLAFTELGRKPPHLMTAVRWARKGKFGVRLETRRFNGRYETTVAAVLEFLSAVERATEPQNRIRDRRARELDTVSSSLDELLDQKSEPKRARVMPSVNTIRIDPTIPPEIQSNNQRTARSRLTSKN